MKERAVVDPNIDPFFWDTMSKTHCRSNSAKIFSRSAARRYLYLLIVSCFSSTIFFFITFYSSNEQVFAFFTYISSFMFLGNSPRQQTSAIQTSIGKKKGLSIYDEKLTYHDFNYLDNKTLTYEKRTYSNNIEVLFRLPKKVPIFALLLIFHGCSRSAHDWFHTIERQRIIGAAVDLGYGCLAFQTTDDFSRCWSNEIDISENNDAQMVWKGLDGFYNEYPDLKSLPRFTFGASSGGIFASIFAINQRYKIQGQIIFISIVLPELLQTHVKAGSYPPTAWIYMSRDIEFASELRINESMKIFAKENIPHISYVIEPIPLTSTTFHNRIPTITKETSEYIFYRLQQNHWLDSQNYLKNNPRRKNTWPDFLSFVANKTIATSNIFDNLNQHKNILPDFFNTIYGEHEISFERSFEALQWHKNIYSNRTNSTM